MTEETEETQDSQLSFESAWTPGNVLYYGPGTRTLCLHGPIDTQTCLGLISQVLELDHRDPDEPIYIHVNTEGGSLTDSFAIYDCLRTVRSPIITVATGVCASAGLIVLAGGDIRLCTETTIFFYHQTILSTETFNSVEDIDATAESYRVSQDLYDEIIRKRCGMTKAVWKKNFMGRTAKYFRIDDALKFNFIDSVIKNKKKSKMKIGD
jgi:ATP-dependent Clp protease protease subunit